ncbi:unnamed protein product [Rotaria sp. Silwood1]|nr:unnamed protein product [Rotaria sp. Silwood1]CAF0904801.1 unnamed protein product [Rotaria sp. Silwood1]CAF3391768.1 unnamed protein product [Rotaria sp. Silwood1]CAF4689910.1 unnamed protein product [Rotaria sp. Silwood1]
MFDEKESLRPYPIDPVQDKVVRKILRVKEKGPVSRTVSFFSNISQRITLAISEYVKEKSKGKKIEKKEADEIIHPLVCTPIDALDSKYFYAIRDGRIWFKPIAAHPDARWRLLGKNGYANKRKTPLISVSADGDNMIVVDQNQTIHYAKTNRIICQVSFVRPQWNIIQSSISWREKWFGMEGVSLIVNLIKNPILHMIPNARSIAVSHKGPATMYYTDMNGKKHPDPYVGVTSIYTLNADGTRIFFADPWLHNKFQNELTGPEEGQFIAETLAASGSTIMLLQRARNELGQEINKIYTRFADFDSIGSNPALKATYNKGNRIPMIRYIPSEDWIRQPSIILSGKARLTKNIAVLQIGWGQNNRQLRVQGQDINGRNGYYFKNIYDMTWAFEITNNILIEEEEFLPYSIPHIGFEQGPRIIEDFKNGVLKSRTMNKLLEITLENFSRRGLNERGLHTKLVLTLENGFKLCLPLYARRGWKSLLGISGENIWKLIIPDEYYDEEDKQVQEVLRRIFKNKRRHPVHVYERSDEIRITNVLGNNSKFEFTFRNKPR